MKTDIYQSVTAHIIADLEKGVRPWFKPWDAEHLAGRISRPLRANGVGYRGINVVMLWAAAVERGYSVPIWMTFKQAVELGGHVRKGEKGSQVVYANTITRSETDSETGEDRERDIPFMKAYTVFNAEQVDGLPAQFYSVAAPAGDAMQRIAAAEAFFANTGAVVSHGGNRAFYSPAEDRLQMPPFEAFLDPGAYYATRAHETTHWTKAPHRLDRDFGRKRFGDAGYAMEELVAELGAAFLCADLGLSQSPGRSTRPILAIGSPC
jgi:antirestriction protein ArdC